MINQWEETQLLTSSVAEGKSVGIQGHSVGERNTFTMLYQKLYLELRSQAGW